MNQSSLSARSLTDQGVSATTERHPGVSVSDLHTAASDLQRLLSKDTLVRTMEPLGPKTTLKVGGAADLYVVPSQVEDLAETLAWAGKHSMPIHLLGRGSNLLVSDEGVRGVVVSLASQAFLDLEVNGEQIRSGAGVRLKRLSERARQQGLAGLEFLEGIPGSVGGALRMNAGAMGQWIFDVVLQLTTMDRSGQLRTYRADQITAGYRHCPLLIEEIAIEATFRTLHASEIQVKKTMEAYATQRRSSQPIGSSAGCMFKNPEGGSAGKLIDELGLKGQRMGQAVISEIHGNFIINQGGASAQDVLNLMELVRKRAREDRGVELEIEVQRLGL